MLRPPRQFANLALAWALAFVAVPALAEPLPDMGPAAGFTLTTQDGKTLSLAELRGKVVLLAFVYTSCTDVCLTETAKMVQVQNGLGDAFGRDVWFVSVSMDPEVDTGEQLKHHARQFGANLAGWTFLTGTPAQVERVAHDYGVVFRKVASGDVEHNTMASIVDGDGRLRVQYMGVEFDPKEMQTDIEGLMRKGNGR